MAELACQKCLERFADEEHERPSPLQCGHSLCLRCTEQQHGPDGAHGEQRCPTCREVAGSAELATLKNEDFTIAELDVSSLACCGPSKRQDEKAQTLERVRRCGVRRLVHLFCNHDPDWSLALLRAASGRVEELGVLHPPEDHLLVMHAAPRLRRLYVGSNNAALDAGPFELPARAPGVQWLRVWGPRIPRATLRALLRAHAATLRTLWLYVGTPGTEDWPFCCNDVHALLAECGLAGLSRLVLWRNLAEHSVAACPGQLQAARAALPSATVECRECDEVEWEEL